MSFLVTKRREFRIAFLIRKGDMKVYDYLSFLP